jgi:hypothetical protein
VLVRRAHCHLAAVLLLGACNQPPDTSSAPAERAAPPPAVAVAPVVAPPAPDAAVARPPGAELVITPAIPRPGMSATVTFDATLEFDLNFGGLMLVTASKQSKRKKVVIAKVDPDGTVHKRITYTKRDTHILVDGEPRKDVTPIRGKTFLVAWKDAVIDVRRANGTPAGEEEVKAVRAEEGQLQVPDILASALANLQLVEGVPFEVPVAAIERMINGDFRARRAVLTYLGKTAEGARIGADVSIVSAGQGIKYYVELKGELVLDSTGWCLRADINGQVRAELSGSVVGSGSGIGHVTATPLR